MSDFTRFSMGLRLHLQICEAGAIEDSDKNSVKDDESSDQVQRRRRGMKKEIVDVVHGKHITYEVIRIYEWSGRTYMVQMSNGKRRSPFSRLDDAVAWAREQARSN